jgi:hypothetical protein
MNQNKHIITHVIAPTLFRHFKNLHIKRTEWGVLVYIGLNGVVCGLCFSVPRDLNLNYLCEVSTILPNNALTNYFRGGDRCMLATRECIITSVYQGYLRYKILDHLNFVIFNYNIINRVKERKKRWSLGVRAFFDVSSRDISKVCHLLL